MPRKTSSTVRKKPCIVDLHVGEKIKALRKARKLTQAQLARVAGLDTMTIASYEQGLRLPGIVSAVKLARGLMVDLSDLCFLPLDMHPEDFVALPVVGTGSSKRS